MYHIVRSPYHHTLQSDPVLHRRIGYYSLNPKEDTLPPVTSDVRVSTMDRHKEIKIRDIEDLLVTYCPLFHLHPGLDVTFTR